MSTVNINVSEEKARWLNLLTELVQQVRLWAQPLDWSTRQIEKRLDDHELGTYLAPALLLQKDTVRIILEPIARSSPGTDGVVDIYLLPAYDDIASLSHDETGWKLHYLAEGDSRDHTPGETSSCDWSRERFEQVLNEMLKRAVTTN